MHDDTGFVTVIPLLAPPKYGSNHSWMPQGMLEGSVLLLVASSSLTLKLQKGVIPPPWLDAEGQIQSSPPSFELKVPIPVLLLQPWLGHRDPPR